MKWYTCTNEHGLGRGGEWLIVAINSCLANTSMTPHLVYSGRENALIDHFSRIGVVVIRHDLSFVMELDAASPRDGFDKIWAGGTFLRFDIPLLEEEDDVVLYTDTDVVFCREVSLPDLRGVLAAANEYDINGTDLVELDDAFNAGVMALNVPAMRKLHPTLVRFTVADDFHKGALGWYDQGILNMLFRQHRVHLRQAANWRPFAPRGDDPEIIHFHLIKPNQIASLERGATPSPDVSGPYLRLYERARSSYGEALAQYRRYVTSDAVAALRSAFPDSPAAG